MPLESNTMQQDGESVGKELPKGVVLGPDGKPYAWPYIDGSQILRNEQLPNMHIGSSVEGHDEEKHTCTRTHSFNHATIERYHSTRATIRMPTRRRTARPLIMDTPTHSGSFIS
jgi:hypothetical protein